MPELRMPEFDLEKVIRLLESANDKGINVSCTGDELSLRFQKGNKIDKGTLDQLKLNKPFIIHYFKTHAANGKIPSIPRILKTERDGVNGIQVSYAQERLWFIDQLEGSTQYHIPAVLQLKGDLNIDALTNAIQQIINRHEVLRSVIREKDGKAWQYIKEKDGWQLNIVDGSMYPEDGADLQIYIQQLINQPFNLANDYMIRAHLIALTDQYHVLVVTLHHIASDGWSTSIIVRELVELYNAFDKGREPGLLPLPIQYADFAYWQRQYLHGDVLDKKLGYWKQKLQGLTTLHLPLDHERPPVQSTHGAAINFKVDKEVSQQMQLLAQEQGATLFMALLAAFNVLLYRYSGQQDICVGTPIAGRDQQEVEALIGFFINSLALRTDLSGNPSFTSLLKQVKATTLEAYDHKELPFEKVVDAIVTERNLSRSPIFQVMFVLQNLPDVPAFQLGDVAMSLGSFDNLTAKYDLSFFIAETDDGLYGTVNYCTDLFDKKTVSNMAAHFNNLLQSIVKAPRQIIGALPMLNAGETDHLLSGLNDTRVSFSNTRTVVDLFQEQCSKSPNAMALVFGGTQLTYAELNERSNKLAHYLRKKGVKQDTLVPVCMNRSIELITAMLGILKAGGAYVPIDPDYPADRISFMLQDTAALLLLTNNDTIQRLPVLDSMEIIGLEEQAYLINQQPSHSLASKVEPHQLAYVIYTSGSTGKPKGVMIEHAGLTNLMNWHNHAFQVSPSSRATAMAGIGFDAFGWEVWPYLSCGASLYIIDDSTRLDPLRLVALFAVNCITHCFIATALVQEFTNGSHNKELALQYLLTGGDKLPTVNKEGLSYKIINNYGPTENTVVATSYQLSGDKKHTIPPIGKPVSNTFIYLLNEQHQLVPQGVPGELYIGGAGLARGYLNQAGLTDEKFISNPFDKTPGSRLYKSGDLGRWLPDGNIEYLGRIDEQVKLRGFRIELGEIETCLLQSGLVAQAIVLAREGGPGSKRLVSYVVAEGLIDKEAIMAYLHGKLPEYMVPAIWVQLNSFPLTPNGKIDRKALPVPDNNELLNNDYIAPRNEAEEKLAAIWKELLYVQRVGIHDNFFELGGDSILTIQVVSRARRMGFELQPKDLFINQTIAKLSAAIADRSAAAIVAEQGILTGLSGLLPIQQWWLQLLQQGTDHFNQGVLLGLNKDISPTELGIAIKQIVEHHDALRFKYYQQNNEWQQEYGAYQGEVITEDLQLTPAHLLASTITQKASLHQQSLHLKKGELIRVVLMQTPASQEKNRLLIIVHHLAVDGVSWRILLEDLERLLNELKSGETAGLGAKGSSYRQWYHALQNYAGSRRLSSQLNYWRKAANNFQPLPVDEDYTGAVKVNGIAQVTLGLDAEKTNRLLQEVPRVYHTEINDILLAALAVTISDWSGMQSINIGLEGHGREAVIEGTDTSRTIGWFTSLYPLQITMPHQRREADIIKSVKEQLRQLPDKGLGYGVLKYINKDAALQGVDPWDIVFNYLGQLDNVVRESKWLSGAAESQGAGRSDELLVTEKISINSSVRAGELQIGWSYSSRHYHPETINKLSQDFLSNIEKLIAHCIEQQKAGGKIFTPSDYGLGSEITYPELDNFLAEKIDGKERRYLIDGLYRLSGLQQGMLFHGLYDVGIGAYIEQFSCDLFGVDPDLLNKSWVHLIKRHSILRSAFYFDAFSVPVQCVYKEVELPLEVLDYRAMNEQEQALAIKAYYGADKNKGIDFKTAPLMRLALLRFSNDRYRMLWTSHHILFDGWSFPILMEEFLSTYELLSAGGQVVAGPEDRYEDYIRYIERGNQEQEETYWRNYLKGIEQSTLLPFIATTSERNKGAGTYQTEALQLKGAAAARVQGFAQRNRVTLNTIMQGVWAFLLHRYTGNKNIVYGIIVSGRPDDLSGVEHRVGMYINTLPLYSAIDEQQGITAWLQGIQNDQASSRQYQHTPFPIVQGWSGVQGDLFDTLLTFENYPISKVISAKKWALNVGNIDMQDQTNYPLSIVIGAAENINIRFSYNALLLDGEYVKEMRDHFENVLMQIVEIGDGKLSEINLLTAAERQQLLTVFNDTTETIQSDKTVISLFEEQSAKSPAALAVVYKEDKFTYHDLNAKANQLANHLRSKGIKEETLVPICMEPGVDMLVSILAILKAGGAYVPVDPDYPQERIAFILEDTGASVVITNKANSIKLPPTSNIEIIEIDREATTIEQYPTKNLNELISHHQLAYIIYTSGSTGKPKGVMIEHGSLFNYLLNNKTRYMSEAENENNAGSYIHLSYTFDASVTALFMPLLFGRPVVIGSKQSVDIFEDANLLKYAPYDFIKITPAHLGLLQPKFKSFGKKLLTKKIVIGGEALYPAQLEGFVNDAMDVEIINEYGPTEATVGCTTYCFYTLRDKDKIMEGVPIGKPISNTVIYILDECDRLVPAGVKGQLCIGGAGLARGYLHLTELTAEKFINDPFLNKSGARIYKTGDTARWLPDGNIEYLGRMDGQVKIRGYRVELGEIEQALQQCECVSQGVVLAKDEKEGGKRLVSYYVPTLSAVKSKERALNIQRVASWKELYETEYGQTEGDENIDPEFNIIGWNDSFTGQAIPAVQMKEWLDDIVAVVLSGTSGNVLEIGCGTGLIYYQLAGKVNKYIGCDLSRSSVNQIKERIGKGLRNYGDTELFTAPAHEVTISEGQPVDTVLLNSMVQYFPGEDYMDTVIAKAMELINGKGRIIIGDVRDNRLLQLFKARLRIQKSQDFIGIKEFQWGLEQDLLKEEELCFSPGYFYGLKEIYPQITHVEIQWKQGAYINELSLYRFTVVVYVGIEKEQVLPQWQSWDALENKNQLFSKNDIGQSMVALKDVPNPRLGREQLLQLALQNKSVTTVGEIMHALQTDDQGALQINQLLAQAVAKGYGYRLFINEDPLKVNLLFEQLPSDVFIRQPLAKKLKDEPGAKTNIPLFTDISFLLQKDIRSFLQNSLPDYMLPSEFTALRQLPLTHNGKVDRLFLSQRDDRVFVNTLNYLPPSTDIEIALARIWKELLHLEKIGIEDDFFDLGGHSLLAMRVIAAIRKELEVELNIKELFIHPTIGSLAGHIQKQSKGLSLPSVELVVPRPERIPLSFSQERLWFIHQLDGSLQYHIPAVLRLKGNLDTAALSGALQQIINRHEILRTVIREKAGKGYQHIKEKGDWRLPVMDGSNYKQDVEGLQHFIKQLTDEPFDIAQDDMLRALLINIDAGEHVLVVTIHHIASDGWSTSIMVSELVELYNAYLEKRTAQLNPLPIQYADYAIWQRKYLQGEQWDKKLFYWKEKLEGVSPLQLPTDYPRPFIQSTNGGIEGFKIDKHLADQLQAFSQQQGATLFMTLLAAFNVLLYRYSGQQDVCIGTPIAGRQQQEVEGLIGFFVNTLALRSEVNGSGPFTELLQQVKLTTLEAYENQEVPFEKVVELVARERDMSRSPVFQVMMVLQNTPAIPALRLGDVQMRAEGNSHTVAMFDLTLSIRETDNGLLGAFEYCNELYASSTIRRMVGHFTMLLQSIIKESGQSIGALPMLAEAERQQLITGFNNTQIDFPKDKTIIDLFEQQAASTPDAIAILSGQQSFSYKELNEMGNRLAHNLQRKGVHADVLIPICAERSIVLIVGLLGILKAGGAYVPIDPDYPPERIKYMLDDTGASIVLTSHESRLKFEGEPGIDIIEIDGDWETGDKKVYGNLQTFIEPHNLAYVIYTSGSTGKPKGVMIEHASLLNYVLGFKKYFSMTAKDCIIQQASISFDTMVEELYPALISGASVRFIKDGGKDIVSIQKYIEANETTILSTTPMVIDYLNKELPGLGKLRHLISGGDVLYSNYINNFIGKVSIANGYGPSETTVCATFNRVANLSEASLIGKPIDNASIFIVSKENELVPLGVAGEICIGGAGLARGYLNNEVLTKQKFISNRFSTEAGSALYKSGDLGRWLPDGKIEYLGRMDDQVKIRGYRIELGEVENVLLECEAVRQAVVLVKKDKDGNNRLVGYVIFKDGFKRDELITYLKTKLPEYMVPALWIEMESFPLNNSGKINKKALPEPEPGTFLTNEYVAPRTPLEMHLVEIWKDLLQVERVGVFDNFFELGGHSLLAMRMVAYIEKALLVSIPIKVLFQATCISDLSKYLEIQSVEKNEENIKPFKLFDV